MACKIIFPETGNIVEVRLNGELTFETFRDMHADLFYGGQWRTGMNLLAIIEKGADMTGVDAKRLRNAFREEVERLHALRGPDYKVAWVAEEPSSEPLLLKWQSMPFVNGAYDLEIFRDRGEAREWLETFAADWPEFYSPAQLARRA